MITSIQNNQVKQWKKLHTKKERMKRGLFLIEGFHLLQEALESKWEVKEVIVREDVTLTDEMSNIVYTLVSKQVFDYLSQTETPQGIIAVMSQAQSIDIEGNQLLLVDRVQDPGNMGTLIRTADAAGFSGVVLGKATVDLYNDKVIRATQGSLFHIPIIHADLLEVIPMLKEQGFSIWGAALEGAIEYTTAPLVEKTALIVGNEGAGIHPDLLQIADTKVKIPIYGKAESLNVSIAAGILMYYLKG